MARVRAIQISNFRGIKSLLWFPSPGINCLAGPGDSGKSTILDAIDLCLGARRQVVFSDADFYRLEVRNPISIEVTVGDLDDRLKNFETYGLYLRGFNPRTKEIKDEPDEECETVLTIRLTVNADLEPVWSLVSDRAEAQGQTRNLAWGDRVRLAPTRLGSTAAYHLAWRQGSILNRISEERVSSSSALAEAIRAARAAFGDQAKVQLAETLSVVNQTARELGIPVGNDIRPMLDVKSVSLGDSTIALHDDAGVPLYGLGTGSTRLLIAGLHRRASVGSGILLIDELEYGLEPHRIIRLLGELGAKESEPPVQVFMTTHSPVALRELSGTQIFIVRPRQDSHVVLEVGSDDDIQGTIRKYPDAFLASSIIVCEGASEVGLIRGLDLFRSSRGFQSITAKGVALIDSEGGHPNRAYRRANALRALEYKVAVLRDDDKKPDQDVEAKFVASGGKVFRWGDDNALEDELFTCLSDAGVKKLLDRAIELRGCEMIDANIRSAANGAMNLDAIKTEVDTGHVSVQTRKILATAARRSEWFKTVGRMEDVARDIVGPDLENADPSFRKRIESIFEWAGT